MDRRCEHTFLYNRAIVLPTLMRTCAKQRSDTLRIYTACLLWSASLCSSGIWMSVCLSGFADRRQRCVLASLAVISRFPHFNDKEMIRPTVFPRAALYLSAPSLNCPCPCSKQGPTGDLFRNSFIRASTSLPSIGRQGKNKSLPFLRS